MNEQSDIQNAESDNSFHGEFEGDDDGDESAQMRQALYLSKKTAE